MWAVFWRRRLRVRRGSARDGRCQDDSWSWPVRLAAASRVRQGSDRGRQRLAVLSRRPAKGQFGREPPRRARVTRGRDLVPSHRTDRTPHRRRAGGDRRRSCRERGTGAAAACHPSAAPAPPQDRSHRRRRRDVGGSQGGNACASSDAVIRSRVRHPDRKARHVAYRNQGGLSPTPHAVARTR